MISLDALQTILTEDGMHAVTLDAVAAAAGVSKGGLLYHFPSKEAMLDAFVQRMCDTAEAEFAEAEQADDVVASYLRASAPGDTEAALLWSLIATLRTSDVATAEARQLVTDFFARWEEILHRKIDDPVIADIVCLAGDGIYLRALAGLSIPDDETLAAITDRLARLAGTRP
ncbi:TetR/AcrR family transcriptional regulator [Actinobacteria bacterium YIM 96077]|uniref:TetR/AcrR family transcriptional regulator n=1 Tax=Phytoactinopolyspora halophila TaxID=1981511 RepID=A0A329QHD9_9ACTN|nr:TetR/AcrR family transcriptional regulator [Phytoactinopolyspora halophila]AYY15520.1 TetR/AcrR family transcriptional regulator [Actinobacteria bacterium YIM 96077]RAW10762.1 TetR/AcrR family transcriptional regulator [Phytoactinopolyspora halophila]